MTEKERRIRQTIDLTEFVHKIDRLAKQERRIRAHMVQQLIAEALAAREEKENKDLIG